MKSRPLMDIRICRFTSFGSLTTVTSFPSQITLAKPPRWISSLSSTAPEASARMTTRRSRPSLSTCSSSWTLALMPLASVCSSMAVWSSLNSHSTHTPPGLRWSRLWGTWSTLPQAQWLDWPSSTPWKHPSLRKMEQGQHTCTSHELRWLWLTDGLKMRWRRLQPRRGRLASRSLLLELAGWTWALWRPLGVSHIRSMCTWWPTLAR